MDGTNTLEVVVGRAAGLSAALILVVGADWYVTRDIRVMQRHIDCLGSFDATAPHPPTAGEPVNNCNLYNPSMVRSVEIGDAEHTSEGFAVIPQRWLAVRRLEIAAGDWRR